MNKSLPTFEPLEGRELFTASPAVANEKGIAVKNLFDVNDVSLNQSLVSVPSDGAHVSALWLRRNLRTAEMASRGLPL